MMAESEEAKPHYFRVLLLFCATAGKKLPRRSRTTLLLATLNVFYSGVQQLVKKKQNHIVLCFSGYSLLQQTVLSEKKKNHITSDCRESWSHSYSAVCRMVQKALPFFILVTQHMT
jgi:hypothetical protein